MPNCWILPNVLDPTGNWADVMPARVVDIAKTLDGLIAENEKEGRRFLKRLGVPLLPVRVLNEHSSSADIDDLIGLMRGGQCWGLISDSGMPCLADPGSNLIKRAYAQGLTVDVCTGPSSIMLGLILSGLSAQKFTFHGYLPKEEGALASALKEIHRQSIQARSTHLFIEAPYRNDRLVAMLLKYLPDTALLCLASDLTAPTQSVITLPVGAWKKRALPVLDDRPTLFLVRGA